MLLSSGLITAPWGLPFSGVHSRKPSKTPCLRNNSISFSTRLSDTFCPTKDIRPSCGIVSK